MKKQFLSYETMRLRATVPIYWDVEYARVGLGDTTFYVRFPHFTSFSFTSFTSFWDFLNGSPWKKRGIKKTMVCGSLVWIG